MQGKDKGKGKMKDDDSGDEIIFLKQIKSGSESQNEKQQQETMKNRKLSKGKQVANLIPDNDHLIPNNEAANDVDGIKATNDMKPAIDVDVVIDSGQSTNSSAAAAAGPSRQTFRKKKSPVAQKFEGVEIIKVSEAIKRAPKSPDIIILDDSPIDNTPGPSSSNRVRPSPRANVVKRTQSSNARTANRPPANTNIPLVIQNEPAPRAARGRPRGGSNSTRNALFGRRRTIRLVDLEREDEDDDHDPNFFQFGIFNFNPPAPPPPNPVKRANEVKIQSTIQKALKEAAETLPPTASPSSGFKCPVCFETTGEGAKMMSLKCGHVLCNDCVDRILKTGVNSKKCPICNNKVINRKDLRALYFN